MLIVAGEHDQPDMLRIADLLAAGIPDARTVIVPNIAHLLPLEQPEAFNRLVLDFLAEQAR